MTIRQDVDQLIDWYEQHCHVVGRVLPVIAAPSTLRTFARKRRNGPYLYRGCEIVPIARLKKKQHQTELTHESRNIADD